MPKKTIILPDSDGNLGRIDEAEWRRRDLESRHRPLFETLHETPSEPDLKALNQGVPRWYGAMAGGGGHGG